MPTLSARSSPAVKYSLPFVVVLAACTWTYWSDQARGQAKSLWIYIAVALMLSAITVLVFRRGPWSKADSVECVGDFLFVKRFRTTETISLDQLKSISWENRVVHLEFTYPNSFGSGVDFHVATEAQSPGISVALEALAERVRVNGGRNAA